MYGAIVHTIRGQQRLYTALVAVPHVTSVVIVISLHSIIVIAIATAIAIAM